MNAELVRIALLGTARSTGTAQIGTSTGTLVAQLPETDPEHDLLFRAGAEAIYRQAGQCSRDLPATIDLAPLETLAVCPPGVARLIADMLATRYYPSPMLPEALIQIRRAGMRLPPELIPIALDNTSVLAWKLLVHVLGERGRWLSRFNSQWYWVDEKFAEDDPPPPDAEMHWHEGREDERLRLMRRIRMHDPTRARTLIADTWRQERVEFRRELMDIFAINLSQDDEPFLESILGQPGFNIRWYALSKLLARLPDSEFVQRAEERADRIVRFTPGGEIGAFTIDMPTTVDHTWARDGIDMLALSGINKGWWWLQNVLSYVRPDHWSMRFAAPPATLARAAGADMEWGTGLIGGLSYASILHRDPDWANALIHHMYAVSEDTLFGPAGVARCGILLSVMRPSDADRFVVSVLNEPKKVRDKRWFDLLKQLDDQWSPAIGVAFVRAIRGYLDSALTDIESQTTSRVSRLWLDALKHYAAFRLPPECFPEALEPWSLPATDSPYHDSWQDDIQTFTDIIRRRQRMIEEIGT